MLEAYNGILKTYFLLKFIIHHREDIEHEMIIMLEIFLPLNLTKRIREVVENTRISVNIFFTKTHQYKIKIMN